MKLKWILLFLLVNLMACASSTMPSKHSNQKGEISKGYLNGYGIHSYKSKNKFGHSVEVTHWGVYKSGKARGYEGFHLRSRNNNQFCAHVEVNGKGVGVWEKVTAMGGSVENPVREEVKIGHPLHYSDLCSTLSDVFIYRADSHSSYVVGKRHIGIIPLDILAVTETDSILLLSRRGLMGGYHFVNPYSSSLKTALRIAQDGENRVIELVDGKSGKARYSVRVPYRLYPLRAVDRLVDIGHFTRFNYKRDMKNEELLKQINEQGYRPYNDLPDQPLTSWQMNLLKNAENLQLNFKQQNSLDYIYNYVPSLLSRHLGPLYNDYYIKNDAKILRTQVNEIEFFVGEKKLSQLTLNCPDRVTSGVGCSPKKGDWWINLSDSSISYLSGSGEVNITPVAVDNTLWGGIKKNGKLKGVFVTSGGNTFNSTLELSKINTFTWNGKCYREGLGTQKCKFADGKRVDGDFTLFAAKVKAAQRAQQNQIAKQKSEYIQALRSQKHSEEMAYYKKKSAENRRARQQRQQLIGAMSKVNAELSATTQRVQQSNRQMVNNAIKSNAKKSSFKSYERPTVGYTRPRPSYKQASSPQISKAKPKGRIVVMTKEACLKERLNTWENGQCITNIPFHAGNCYSPDPKVCYEQNKNKEKGSSGGTAAALGKNLVGGQAGGAPGLSGDAAGTPNADQEKAADAGLGPAQATCWVGSKSKKHHCAGPLQILPVGYDSLPDALRAVACQENRIVGVYTGKGKAEGTSVTLYNCGRPLKATDIDVRSLGYY